MALNSQSATKRFTLLRSGSLGLFLLWNGEVGFGVAHGKSIDCVDTNTWPIDASLRVTLAVPASLRGTLYYFIEPNKGSGRNSIHTTVTGGMMEEWVKIPTPSVLLVIKSDKKTGPSPVSTIPCIYIRPRIYIGYKAGSADDIKENNHFNVTFASFFDSGGKDKYLTSWTMAHHGDTDKYKHSYTSSLPALWEDPSAPLVAEVTLTFTK